MEYPEGEPCPAGRRSHAAVCLGQGTRPQLVVIGGQDNNSHVLNDVLWILDVESERWKEVSLRIDMAHKFSIVPYMYLHLGIRYSTMCNKIQLWVVVFLSRHRSAETQCWEHLERR